MTVKTRLPSPTCVRIWKSSLSTLQNQVLWKVDDPSYSFQARGVKIPRVWESNWVLWCFCKVFFHQSPLRISCAKGGVRNILLLDSGPAKTHTCLRKFGRTFHSHPGRLWHNSHFSIRFYTGRTAFHATLARYGQTSGVPLFGNERSERKVGLSPWFHVFYSPTIVGKFSLHGFTFSKTDLQLVTSRVDSWWHKLPPLSLHRNCPSQITAMTMIDNPMTIHTSVSKVDTTDFDLVCNSK